MRTTEFLYGVKPEQLEELLYFDALKLSCPPVKRYTESCISESYQTLTTGYFMFRKL